MRSKIRGPDLVTDEQRLIRIGGNSVVPQAQEVTKRIAWICYASLFVITAVMVLLPLSPTGDVYYFARAARTILAGGLIYRDVEWTYPPLYAYLMAPAMFILGDKSYAWKILPIIFHIATGILILKATRRWTPLFLYIFSPLPFLASSIWGSFDVVAGFFTVLALVLLLRGRHALSAISLAVGINMKYFPVVLLIPMLLYLKRDRFLCFFVVLITSLLMNFPFMLLAWNDWLQQAVLFQLARAPGGYSLYNLITGNLWGGPPEVGLVLPLGLFLLYFVSHLRRRRLLENSALVMTAAVLFNKVVLWYAQWFVPLVILCYQQRRRDPMLFATLFLSQIFVYAGGTLFGTVFGNQLNTVLTLGWLYQATTAVIAWRLLASLRH